MEIPDQVVTMKVSREVVDALKDWSGPVQIRIRPGVGGDHEMDVRTTGEVDNGAETLAKVLASLHAAGWGWEPEDATDALTTMQNAGILFRERG
jgi:hypothetical protein